MKICMLIDSWTPWWGGGPAHVWEISKNLVKNHNCQVDILVPNFGVSQKTSKNPRVIPIGPKIKSPNLVGRLLFLISALSFLISGNYDLYHSHSYLTSLLFPFIKIFKRKKFAFTLHGVGVKIFGGGIINNLRIPSFLSDLIIYKISYDILFTVAKSSLTQKPAAKKLVVIGNGVDVEKFNDVKVRKNPKIFKILWVGRFDPVKNVSALVKSLIKLPPKVQLTLVGEGQERKNIELLVRKLKLQDRVTFKGFLTGTTLIREYKSSNLFVLPSLSEGFPVVLLEAMAANVPIVATNVGDIKDIIGSAKSVQLISAKNPNELTKKLTSSSKSHKMKPDKPSYKKILAEFQWATIAIKYFQIYNELS